MGWFSQIVEEVDRATGGSGDRNPIDMFADALIQYSTAGLVGVQDGKPKKGVAFRGLDEGLGEITGRNMMRDSLWQQRVALENEQLARQRELLDERERERLNDISASNTAQASRSRGRPGMNNLNFDPNAGLDRDFLGL